MKYLLLILVLFFFAVSGCLESSPSISNLSISTEQDVYHSNETMNVHIGFTSEKDGQAQVTVAGIKNAFGRALIIETREVIIKKGVNGFDFEFKTPSCEECSALAPGVHSINATVNIDSKTFETYKKITLEREK